MDVAQSKRRKSFDDHVCRGLRAELAYILRVAKHTRSKRGKTFDDHLRGPRAELAYI